LALDYIFGTGTHQGRDVGETPALILLDIKLPKIDGIAVLREIRKDPRTRRTPVVILTSSAEEKDLAAGYDGGVNSYLCKPVSLDRLVEAMGYLGIYWLLLNKMPPRVEGV
jgi:two-component system response regulator